MILGLDFYGTITQHPQAFRELSEAVIQFDEVWIITAVKRGNKDKVLKEIKKSLIQCTGVRVIEYDFHKQVPKLKLEACLELGVRIFIDDREDTIRLLRDNGIIALEC